uniref:Uncharacterized protein n=1 Tax=Arcella intermedia TaxID=1963864 RepID=A0A6B2LMQ7_9EUKA
MLKARKRINKITLNIKRQKVGSAPHAPVGPEVIAKQLWRQAMIYVTPDKIELESGALNEFGSFRVGVLLGEKGEENALGTVIVRVYER